MKVLVIGGAGYIGSHVVKLLCDKELNVLVYDNLSTGDKKNVDKRAIFLKGDILDEKSLDKVFSRLGKSDVVMHFAALKAAGESMLFPEKYSKTNITGSLNILNAMSRHDVKHMIFSSSAAVYGSPKYLPMDESHPINPENYYGFTKAEIEKYLAWYSRLKGIRYVALRYFNAAGYGEVPAVEKNPANLLPIVMEVASGKRKSLNVFGDDYKTKDGTGVRDYINPQDLAEAHFRAMNYILKNDKDLTVNLGTGKGYGVLEIIRMTEKITGKKIPYKIAGRRQGDPAEVYASSKRAFKTLGWKAEHSSMKEIIETMWKVYKIKN